MSDFKKAKIPPVIILGMHRSGTTMITKFLDDFGLFVGDQLDDNHESLFFFKLNHWMFKVGISKVDYPQNMLLMNPNCKQELINAVDHHLGHSTRKLYLGSKRYSDIRDLDIPWGWKEPRNTFTLEMYKKLFPAAKIIHIYRNPIDSAMSYMKRDIGRRNHFELTWRKKMKRKFFVAHKYHQNFRLRTIADGYELWKEYVSKALTWEEEFEGRIKVYKYEDFLDEPVAPVKDMAAFSGLSVTDDQVKKAVSEVDAGRKYAFLKDPEAVKFYESIRNDDLMVRLGYDNITA